MDSFNTLYKKIVKESFGEESAEELDALGVEDTDDFDLGEDLGEESGDTVSITIDKSLAQTLIDALKEVVGEDEADDSEEEDLDLGDSEEGESEDEFGFDEDEEEVADGDVVSKNSKMVVDGKVKPKKRTADSKVTDKTGTEAGKENVDHGKNNKVGKLRQGQEFFS